MADQITNLIAPDVMPDLQALVDKLVQVEGEIKTINGQTLSILVDLKGADNLTRLTELMNQQQVTIEKINTQFGEYNQGAQQMAQVNNQAGIAVGGSVRALVEQKQELGYVNEQIRVLNKQLANGGGDIQKNSLYLEQLTKRQIDLKNEIANSSRALKDMSGSASQATESITIFGVNASSIFTRMAVRMAAMQLLFLPVIAGISSMTEAFTRLSPAEKEAADRLKDYTDKLKDLRKAQADYLGDIDKAK